ncbi:MAG TPA: S1/P1 nuclease [Longimicrobiaceae bacterium]|nr:S1/P1 nuclease [Longimicrobiaceae bacterium]
MTKSFLRCGLALALLAAAATPARAWDELGHKVVARIAWDNLTPQARARAIAVLMAAPANSGIRELLPQDGRPLEEQHRDWFVNMSYWADQIRGREHPGNRFHQAEWHYVNHFWEQRTPGGRIIDRPDKGTAGFLLDRLAVYRDSLTGQPTPENAVALAWVLHLVGDVHQPMHNSARITPEDPDGDRGANSFRLAGLFPFNNLHSVWDGLMGPAFPLMRGDASESGYVGRIAQTVQRRHPRSRVAGQLQPNDFTGWSRQGMRLAQQVGYPVWLRRGERVPRRYLSQSYNAVEPRIALAGYRLADMLERQLAR